MLIELFSLGVTAEAIQANIDWKSAFSLQRGQLDPKFQVDRVAPTNHSSCRKKWDKRSFMSYKNLGRTFILSQSTRLTDG